VENIHNNNWRTHVMLIKICGIHKIINRIFFLIFIQIIARTVACY